MKACIACAEQIQEGALLCRFCRTRQDRPLDFVEEFKADHQEEPESSHEASTPSSFGKTKATPLRKVILGVVALIVLPIAWVFMFGIPDFVRDAFNSEPTETVTPNSQPTRSSSPASSGGALREGFSIQTKPSHITVTDGTCAAWPNSFKVKNNAGYEEYVTIQSQVYENGVLLGTLTAWSSIAPGGTVWPGGASGWDANDRGNFWFMTGSYSCVASVFVDPYQE